MMAATTSLVGNLDGYSGDYLSDSVNDGFRWPSDQSWDFSSSLLLSPLPPHDDHDCVDDSKLTLSPGSRHSRPHPLPPSVTTSPINTTSKVAISVPANNTNTNTRQDVRDFVNRAASGTSTPSTATRSDVPTTSEIPASTPRHNDVLNSPSTRPCASTQVFSSSQDLAAHYGIPQILPPAPSTTHRQPLASTSPVFPDFYSLSSNYLNMLSQKPTDNSTEAPTTVSPADLHSPALDGSAQQTFDELLGDYSSMPSNDSGNGADLTDPNTASPEYRSIADFMTSPAMATPYDDFATSPNDDSPYSDFLTTPLIQDGDVDMLTDSPSIDYSNMPLFPELYVAPISTEHVLDATPAPKSNLDNLFTISPSTPFLDSVDPSSLYPSPRLPREGTAFPSTSRPSRRKTSANGTRKNITPQSLIPVDAPTQARQYRTPSATSRKEVPAIIARKRARSTFEEDDDEFPLPLNPTEKELADHKRRQNTVAARKSRMRKLEYQQNLERDVERLTLEANKWRERALMTARMLEQHGHPAPSFDD